jgi:restriction endonuclease S subunit
MSTWREFQFGEVARLEYGKALKECDRSGSGYPVLGSAGIVGLHEESLVEGPVIVVGRKGNAGSVHWVDTACWPIDTTFWVRILEPEACCAPFLAHWLRQAGLTGLGQRGARPGLGRERVHELALRLPSLAVQQDVANTLGSVDAVETACRAYVETIRVLRTARRKSALASVSGNMRRVRDIGTFARGQSFPRNEQGRATGDHPVFKVADMNTPSNERRLLVPEYWVTEEQRQRLKMKLWPAGTVVFARVGAALVGERRRLLVVPSILDDNMFGVVPSLTLFEPYFLMLALEQQRLAAMAQPGAVPSINAEMVGRLEIPAPPLAVQRALVEEFSILDSTEQAAATYLAAAKALSRSLRARLVAHGDEPLDGVLGVAA